jgi:hypothetical protein
MNTTASPTSRFLNANPENPARPIRVNGSPVRNPVAIAATSPKIDTECVVMRSDAGDVVVAFRSSEPPGGLFEKNGSFRDWVLTDLRAQRVPYPPAPGPLNERRWVHAGFWDAFEPIAATLRKEVKRQAGIEGTRALYVTGFSLGGALALLAALDLAEALPKLPVHLWSIAAPRCGDASLNALLAKRTASATSLAWRGDPTPHLPPIGPNFPVTMVNIAKVEIGGFHIPIGNPAIPQLGQQYRTPGRLAAAAGGAELSRPRLLALPRCAARGARLRAGRRGRAVPRPHRRRADDDVRRRARLTPVSPPTPRSLPCPCASSPVASPSCPSTTAA